MSYKNGYVAFLDILGFSQYASDETNEEHIIKMFEFTNKFCYLFNSSPELPQNAAFFSDSIVIVSDDIESLIPPIYIVESYLWNEMKLLFRGGISYGQYYHNNNVLFGPAVIQAYKLEKQANYSRIIIDNKIIKENFQEFDNKLSVFYDYDGCACLNPFATILNEKIAYGGEKPKYPDSIPEAIKATFENNRNKIIEGIRQHKDSAVVDKYLWRIRPFNFTCRVLVDLSIGFVIYDDIDYQMSDELKDTIKDQIIMETDWLS